MFTNIFAVLMAAGGFVVFYFANQFGFETNPAFYGKTILAMLGGVGVLLGNNWSLIKMPNIELITTKPVEPAKVNTETEVVQKIFFPEAYELKDFEALTHLRDRCVNAGSQEGLDACSALAVILFKLDIPAKKV